MMTTRSMLPRFDRNAGRSGCKSLTGAASNRLQMETQPIPLEDTFGDVLRKAMLGTGIDAARLAQATGIDARTLTAWTKDDGTANEAQARTIAPILKLDPGKFADSALSRWTPPPIAVPDVRHHPQKPHPSNGY